MKKLVLITFVASALYSNFAVADAIHSTMYSSERIALAAKQANIHLSTFQQAIEKYEAWLNSVDNPAHQPNGELKGIKPFNQLEAIRAFTSGAEFTPQLQAELISQYNENQTKLATYLGLRVEELMPFVKSHADLYMDTQKPE
ncbi:MULTISPECIES: hypothetical protein [Pseudoalteromonas]|uniref:Uncharacterized protein n=1 Tax=Pseudoalteromonas amylolytica TaxID=1859457 RepID=A0A1S1MQQ3_9GAMM|nr:MULTISPECIES: hypothetical protein [Pseudoalteromonas]OHU85983.1 hypothetical protein BFC16_17115 [Pseudoalteromonas sp. JW3]OHU89407.1 hypothetical protein BET10_17460 [Pseudoalteromonas amylolytica]